MPVNHEVKGNLARLLATEDLVVEHKRVQTACFNVHTRVLTLPMWEKASEAVYDMLVGHEVGHALYTPDDDWWETCKIPKQFVNVVEDVRIEKLMKRRYGGLNKTFYNGYSELNDQDFFSIADENLDSFNLADRVNLYYKIGNFININFTPEEDEIVSAIGDCETFADVLIASEILYKYCVKKEEELQKVSSLNIHEQNGKEESNDDLNQEVESSYEENNTSNDNNSQNKNEQIRDEESIIDEEPQSNSGGSKSSGLDIKTAEALQEAINELVNTNSVENVYVEVPKLNLDTVIIPNHKVHDECSMTWKSILEIDGKENVFDEVDKKYSEFKRSAQKEVNYLVKEFECRKSADSYARATTSRTGVLDCSKLHSYKYNEDIFKKVTTLADGKNHGLVFVIDWSGSMSNVILDTIKQLYNLVWFCKKVNIPFEVYAFTYDWISLEYDENNRPIYPKKHYEKKDGLLHVDETFSMLNILTSKVRGSVLEEQLKNIFRVASYFDRSNEYGSYHQYYAPNKLSLSGTPLNQSLISLHEIIPSFQKENNLQKVHCIVLTDGEGDYLKRHVEIKRSYGQSSYIGLNSVNQSNVFLRDRKTGNTYKFDGILDPTDILVKNLKDKFSTVNFIGMRILNSRDVNNFIRKYSGYCDTEEYTRLSTDWKKNKSFSIKNSGYHTYFGLSSNSLNTSSEFLVDEDATKGQIKSAFVKSLNSKKMNKKVLSEFIDLVA